MLKINLTPVNNHGMGPSEIAYADPVLTVNGINYNLSELPDGATAQHPVLGTVERSGNDYEVTLQLLHGPNAPYETRFPSPIEVTTDGPVTLPLYNE